MRGTAFGSVVFPLIMLAVAPANATVTGTISLLPAGSGTTSQSSPAVSGSRVVWTGVLTSANWDIFLYDVVAGGPPLNITNTPNDTEFLEDIDGTNAVFSHTSPSSPGDIVVYDILGGGATTIASSNSGLHFEQPSISGRYITFLRFTGSQVDVDAYDNLLGLPLAQPVTNDAAVQGRPRVNGDYIVYEDYAGGKSAVTAFRISTMGPPAAVSNNSSLDEIMPDIAGNTIVWVESGSTSDQLMAYDLGTGLTRTLKTGVSRKITPRISGSRIVWSDDRSGDLDLYTYDLTTDTEDPLVNGPGDQHLSDIDGDRVVYTSNAAGFDQVFLFTFGKPPPPPPPPPPDTPAACDPRYTDLVSGPKTLVRNTRRPVFDAGSFTSAPGRSYAVCIENGLPDRTERTSQALFTVDGRVVLSPAQFKPNDNPPHWVTAPLVGKSRKDSGSHAWNVALYGTKLPTTITVSIRSAH
jgi:beta propeller repeat protein